MKEGWMYVCVGGGGGEKKGAVGMAYQQNERE